MERIYSSLTIPVSSPIPETVATSVKMEFGYPCAQCGALASNGKIAKLHNEAHFAGYSCSYCPQVFITEHVLNMHEGIHKKMQKKFVEDNCQCKVCEAAFLSLLYLEFHMIQFHGNDVLKNPAAVRLDVIEERESNKFNGAKDRNYRCGFCLRPFEFAANLECHMTLHPNGKYECNTCPAKFLISEALQMHVNSRHLLIEETEAEVVDSRKIISKPIQIRGGVPKTMTNCKWQLDPSAKDPSAFAGNIDQLHIRKSLKQSCQQTSKSPRFNDISKIPYREECQYANVLIYNLNLQHSSPSKTKPTSSDLKDRRNVSCSETEILDRKLHDESGYINPNLIKVMLTNHWKGE